MSDHEPSVKEQRAAARKRFAVATRLEKEYMRSLRQLSKQIDQIVKGMVPTGTADNSHQIAALLRSYSDTIRPWAQSIARRMLERVADKDEKAWIELSRDIGKSLRKELNDAPIGLPLQRLLDEQVHLITSLPLDAAQRVHKMTTEGLLQGRRASDIAKDILETGRVTESRAKLIARTEVARTAASLTQARSQHVGVTHYIWRTSKDPDVRESHKEMDGKVIPWDTAPTLSDGTKTHAGMIYNCRCYPEPVITD